MNENLGARTACPHYVDKLSALPFTKEKVMTKVNVVQARKEFAELMARVAYGEERIIVERRGKPMMAWVSMEDLQRLEAMPPSASSRAAQRRIALTQAEAVRHAIRQERRGEMLPDSAEQLYQLREARVSGNASF
ncbi:MAG: type II toxin-antitoxin system Phd/YefM family antitoxin [Chloroflexi bacterium]|nr:type II toxin-antitoxin system Phd/YefM family antitoxin [Chloroflexota bacterium]